MNDPLPDVRGVPKRRFRLHRVARFAGALGIAVSAGAQPRGDPAPAFSEYAARAVRDWSPVGLAVAVVKDGRIVFARGYGVLELGRPAPVDTATLFAIGSTTKAMTAAALGMLVDEGKVRWDDPVTRHLPGFQLADPYVTREITIRDLLTHRAGLGNADFLWYRTPATTDEVVRRARFIRPAYSMRSGFIYQNVMYAVAGEVIEAASGMPWDQFLRTRIFEPLDMRRTVATVDATKNLPNVARPHDRIDDTVHVIENAPVDAIPAAGSIWSSVADMAKWTRFMLDSGRVNGRALLKPATWAELLRPQTIVSEAGFYPTARLTKPHWKTYGLGWFQQDYDGRFVSFHTGSIDGMIAILGLIPDERLGVIVLANTDHVEVRHALMFAAFDHWRPADARRASMRDWSAEFRKLYGELRARGDSARVANEAKRITGTKPSLPIEKYAGTYTDSLYGSIQLVMDGGRLRLRAGEMRGTVEHWQYDTFRVIYDQRWLGTDLITFTIGPAGVPSRVQMGSVELRRAPDR